MNKDTMMEKLGIQYIEIGVDYVIASMPVDDRTKQPMGLLHGGASAALVETVGSLGSLLLIDQKTKNAVGLEVSANHVGRIKEGVVLAKAILIHGGKKTHVWTVEIREKESQRLICTGKHTVLILDK